jgi:hypothetical protein
MRWLAVAVLIPVTASGAALAHRSVQPARVRATPSLGSSDATFTLSFRLPERTGTYGSVRRYDLVVGSASAPAAGCLSGFSVRVPDAQAGTRVRVALDPHRLAGRWCPGTYRGKIEELQRPACRRGEMCPAYVILRRAFGHFSLQVRRPAPTGGGDRTPPSFAGLERAFACTPGAQRPGQTTPFTLSWQPASDDRTQSSQIVYDVYLSSTSGAENYATPTWTTPPGVTTYRTPGLASHGGFYFVVRARDQAGNEDHNAVERRGIDPCY